MIIKKILLVIFGIIIFKGVYSQKKLNHNDMVLVPSKVKVDSISNITIQSFWIGNEISNKEFKSFFDYVQTHIDDSLCWRDIHGVYCIRYRDIANNVIDTTIYGNYFKNKKFENYPVIGISYIQAEYYCKWKNYLESTRTKKNNSLLPIYRLPSAEEWNYAASFYLTLDTSNKSNEILPVKSGKPNKIGIYNLSNNVSEWTSTNGDEKDSKIVKGGSWKSKSSVAETQIISETTQKDFIGFRIVMTSLDKD